MRSNHKKRRQQNDELKADIIFSEFYALSIIVIGN